MKKSLQFFIGLMIRRPLVDKESFAQEVFHFKTMIIQQTPLSLQSVNMFFVL